MPLLSLVDVQLAFGGPPLLDGASMALERGDRACLLGRNGAGKSTLLKLLDGTLRPGRGEVTRQGGVTVARLDQEIPEALGGSTFDVAAEGLGPAGALLARYHAAGLRVAREATDAALAELDRLHRQLDAAEAWQLQTRVETVLSHLQLAPDVPFAALSGGRKRQALLARALVAQPDVLLLDEPTNHLDVAAIEWMEEYLVRSGITLLFITHDRAFLRRLATRVLELDRGRLVDWGTDYDTYVERKAATLAAEAKAWAEFDRKLAQEEVWIRKGIEARRTRNEGRVRALEQLRRERAARRERTGLVRMSIQEAERTGKVVFDVRGLTFAHGDRPIVRDLTTVIARGDRIGLLGPNGAGKTTLLRLLLGELAPQAGEVRPGTGLQVAYFDQLRDQLDPEATVVDAVADGAEHVEVHGVRKHVHGYLQEFLFPAERARTPVKALSGGERNRLLLARLFTRRFNVLAMDEPTNDLDLETLELLEGLLAEFDGTLLVASHDRAFLDAVVTSTLVLEGNGRVGEYVGGWTEWERQRPPEVIGAPSAGRGGAGAGAAGRGAATAGATGTAAAGAPPAAAKPRRLTWKETQELNGLPDRIASLEAEREAALAALAEPGTGRDGAALARLGQRLGELEVTLAAALERWVELESLAEAGQKS